MIDKKYYDTQHSKCQLFPWKSGVISYLRMVKKRDKTGLDIEIDELTNSIKNVISGDSSSPDISRITKADLKKIIAKVG